MKEYAKNLYTAKNIIGYTGDINNNPTVYFKKENQYGHITQEHKDHDNIGRELGLSSPFYGMTNSGPKGRLQESVDGEVYHTSRNPFIKIASIEEHKELSKAIDRFKELKPMCTERSRLAKEQALKNVTYKNSFLQTIISTIDRFKNPLLQATVQFEIDLKREAKSLPIKIIDEKMKVFTLTRNKPLISDCNKKSIKNTTKNNLSNKLKF